MIHKKSPHLQQGQEERIAGARDADASRVPGLYFFSSLIVSDDV